VPGFPCCCGPTTISDCATLYAALASYTHVSTSFTFSPGGGCSAPDHCADLNGSYLLTGGYNGFIWHAVYDLSPAVPVCNGLINARQIDFTIACGQNANGPSGPLGEGANLGFGIYYQGNPFGVTLPRDYVPFPFTISAITSRFLPSPGNFGGCYAPTGANYSLS
jgi:hypothetical protein